MLEDYWDLMPQYQDVRLEDLEVLRILFGFFPTYRHTPAFGLNPPDELEEICLSSPEGYRRQVNNKCSPPQDRVDSHTVAYANLQMCLCRASPLQPQFDRMLQIGDASGIQSPLSFGGFGALSRHLPRLRAAIADALEAGL